MKCIEWNEDFSECTLVRGFFRKRFARVAHHEDGWMYAESGYLLPMKMQDQIAHVLSEAHWWYL